MPNTVIDGIKTNYDVVGDGPPLLMFSPGGFDATLDKWSTLGVYARTKIMEYLSHKYRCIVFDRRETGRSGGRVERITWRKYADQGRGLLEHLNIDSAHLMGGCMGCCPVTAFAAAYPEMVRSMILYWPVGGAKFRIRGHSRFAEHLALVDQAGLEGVVALARNTDASFSKDPRVGPWAPVIRSNPAFAADYVHINPEDYKAIVTANVNTLIDRDTAPGAAPEALMRTEIPTLIVPGKDDAHATSAARYLEECLPRAEYWDVPPEAQTEGNVPQRLIDFLDRASADS
jgi:pimeloyl-ACP methyl ester carboxylesterase